MTRPALNGAGERRLPEIDRSFVSLVPGSKHDESVIRTIVAMAQSLDMEVIAEGIETEAQLAYLKSIGCRLGQGYLFDRPTDAGRFARQWLGEASLQS